MAVNMAIQDLKSKITAAGGLQRSNRFYVEIIGPVAPFNLPTDTGTTPTQYIAETVILPDVSMTTQADALTGPGLGRTVPRGIFYKEGILLTFPVFQNWSLVTGLENWLRRMYYPVGGNGTWVTQYYDALESSNYKLIVSALDLNGNVRAKYTFKEAYPIEIAPIQFSSMQPNEYLKITTRFIFRSYDYETIPSP